MIVYNEKLFVNDCEYSKYGNLNPLASCNTNGSYCALEWAAAIQTVCIVGLTQISQGFAIQTVCIVAVSQHCNTNWMYCDVTDWMKYDVW